MAFPPVPFQEWFLRQTSTGNAALNAYVARVKADGGVVEAIGCVPQAVWDWVAPAAPTLLLDLFPNARFALSRRKLRTAYTGDANRVRSSAGGSPESNIGFTSAGDYNQAALESFVSSNNGFEVSVFDQSGNGLGATQTTAANQPAIVNSGTVNTFNGVAASDYDSTDFHSFAQFFEGGLLAAKSDFTLLVVGDFTPQATNKDFMTCTSSTSDRIVIRQNTSGAIFIALGTATYTTTMTLTGGDAILVFINYNGGAAGGTIQVVKVSDGTSETSGSLTFTDDWGTVSASGLFTSISVNTFSSGSSILGELNEMVLWPSNLTASATQLRTNVKSYYGI